MKDNPIASFDPVAHLEACFGLKAQRIGRVGRSSLGFNSAVLLRNNQETISQAFNSNGGYEELAKSQALEQHQAEDERVCAGLTQINDAIRKAVA